MVSVRCPRCGGAGTVAVGRCQAMTGAHRQARQCTLPVRVDPSYFARHPQQGWLRDYCTMHGNKLMRQLIDWGEAPP